MTSASAAGPQRLGRGHAEASSRRAAARPRAVPVNVIAGCSASGSAPARSGRVEHGDAVPPAGVHEQLARPDARRSRRGPRPGRAARRRARSAGPGRRGAAPARASATRHAGQQFARRAGGRRRRPPDTATDLVAGHGQGRGRARARPGRRRRRRPRAGRGARRPGCFLGSSRDQDSHGKGRRVPRDPAPLTTLVSLAVEAVQEGRGAALAAGVGEAQEAHGGAALFNPNGRVRGPARASAARAAPPPAPRGSRTWPSAGA